MAEAVLITGSRDFPDLSIVAEEMHALPKGTLVVVGDARGVDFAAASAARAAGLEVEVHPAQWKLHGKGAGPIRNRVMVARVRQSGGRVVAFWDGISRGTADCVRQAKEAGLPVTTIVRIPKGGAPCGESIAGGEMPPRPTTSGGSR